jgi:hypothetical protein
MVSLDAAMEKADWRAVITPIMGKDKYKPLGNGFLQKVEEALEAHTAPALLPSSSTTLEDFRAFSPEEESTPRRTPTCALPRFHVH